MSSMRIIVTGLVGQHPVGGVAWDYLQYVLGFARLGHDVYYHEDTWSWPYDPVRKEHTSSGEYSARYLDNFFAQYAPELRERWHYRHLHEKSYGMSQEAFVNIARGADVFLNVSGACMIPDGLSARCKKVFLDTDPGYNQIVYSERFDWSPNVERWCAAVDAHDSFFTYAENIVAPDCAVPRLGREWKTTRMPVVLDLWEPQQACESGAWSTVMTWSDFKGPVTYAGHEYSSKGAEFEKIRDLPSRLQLQFRIAVGGVTPPLAELSRAGWDVVDGPTRTLSPADYTSFIAQSRGEVSTAKNIYVALRTGWFSCRSACYLAAGRPAVLQDTGFADYYRHGAGLHVFDDIDEAASALATIEADYSAEIDAARSVAEEEFDSDRVLTRLLDDLFRSAGHSA